MLKILDFLRPPPYAEEENSRLAGILNVILLASILLLSLFIVVRLIIGTYTLQDANAWVLGGLELILVGLWLLMRRGYLRSVSIATIIFSWLALAYVSYKDGGMRDSGFVAFFIVIMMASLLLDWRAALLVVAATIATGWGFAYLDMQGLIPNQPESSFGAMGDLTVIFLLVGILLYLLVSNLRRALDDARVSNRELQQLSSELEKRIDTRTQALQERTRDLSLASEVSRRIAQLQDLDRLLEEAARLIGERFDLYFTQIYLVDEAEDSLAARVGTGESDRQLPQQAHTLPIDTSSINGTAVSLKEPVFVPDTQADPRFRPNPLLPQTRSELAVPLLIGTEVLGVLNLQSSQVGQLTEESLPAFTTLAGQLAVAIRNAQLFAERQAALAEMVPFRLGFERSASAIFMTDVDGVITYVNPAFTELYGYSEEEALGKNPRLIKSGLLSREEYGQFWQVLLNKEPVVGEIVNKRKDGRLVHVASNNVAIVNDEENIVGFLAMQTDITGRKEAQAALDRRVAELDCLNDIGRKAEEAPPLPEFLAWVAGRIPPAMTRPDACLAAVELQDEVYGDANALNATRQMVEGLRAGGEQIGRLTIAYTDNNLTFGDNDSAFIGGIGRRITGSIEMQQLLHALEHQATELQTVAEIGTTVAAIRDPQQLLQTFVDLTKERFNLYHTHVYQFDAKNEILRLTAGAGEIGRRMVAEERKISRHEEQSLVARAARRDRGFIIGDVNQDPDFLPHTLLPRTKSDMAIPIIVFGELRGVLDLQAVETDAFTERDLNIFTTLASQVGIALENAYQYQQAQEALEEVTALQKTMTREGWQAYFAGQEKQVYGFATAAEQLKPITTMSESEQEEFLPLAHVKEDKTAVTAPVQFSGIAIGALGVRTAGKSLTGEQRTLLQAISEQVSQALERARLAEQTQIALSETEARTEELALLNEMSQELTAQTNVDGVLDVVYTYTSRLMPADEFYVALYYDETDEVEFAFTAANGKTVRYTERRQAGDGITEYMIRHRQPLLMPDRVDEHLAELGIAAHGRMAESWLGAPMMLGRRVIGAIGLQSYTAPRAFSEQGLRLLTAIASQAAIAIENARLIEATEERAREEQMLREISNRVNTAVDAESILRTAAEEIGRALGLEGTIILGSDATGNGHDSRGTEQVEKQTQP